MEIIKVINVQGHELNMYGTVEDPLFLAVEVAKMIDYSVGHTAHMLNTIDEDEKQLILMKNNASYRTNNASAHKLSSPIRNINASGISNSKSARGSAVKKWFLTEDGLYEVLMQSRKPIARRFKRAVKDIIKDLRIRGEVDLEDMLNQSDPLVDEWEAWHRDNDEDMEFAEWLKEFKGYTDDML